MRNNNIPPSFEDKKGLFKHVFETYCLLAPVVMILMHCVDLILRKIPGLGTTDLILIAVGIAQIFNYMGYQMKMGHIVTSKARINRKIRFPTGLMQCYDAYGSEYYDNATLAIECQYGLVYKPIELKITDDKLKDSIKLPYLAELPRMMSPENIKASIEELAGITMQDFHIYDLIWDRAGYHKVVGNDDSNQPVVQYYEMIVYCKNDLQTVLGLGPGIAYGGGWGFPHSSVGDLSLDFKGMIKGDVALCQVQESEDEEFDLTPDEKAKVLCQCYTFFNDRVIKRSQVLERWFEQENNGETDQKAQDDARRAVEEDTFMAKHPNEAEDDIDRYKAEELTLKKKETRGHGGLVAVIAAMCFILLALAIIFK